MKVRELATVLVRLAGLWLLLQAFGSMQSFLWVLQLESEIPTKAGVSIHNLFVFFRVAVEGALAFYALSNASTVVKTLIPECRDDEVAASGFTLQRFGIAMLGLVLVGYWLPSLVGHVGEFVYFAGENRSGSLETILSQNIFQASMALGGALFGIVVLWRSERLSKWITRLDRRGEAEA